MNQEEIGVYLRTLRHQHNLTQKELAEKLHVTHQAVSRWENGKSIPDIETLSMIGDLYNISIDRLLLKPKEANMKTSILKKMFIVI